MSNVIGDIIIASVQSVAKVYVIGAIGFGSVKFPRKAPYLPSHVVSVVARFSFNILTIALVYSTTAMAVSPQSIGDYWFVFAGALVVIFISYLTATLLGVVFRIDNPRDFCALRIAASFPNIVALPILIFPSLCEYSVVVESLLPPADSNSPTENDETITMDRQEQCVALSNTMIFCYFFAYSLIFWSFGHPQLMAAARMSNESSTSTRTVVSDGISEHSSIQGEEVAPAAEETSQSEEPVVEENEEQGSNPSPGFIKQLWLAVKQVLTSNGFLAMMAGFLTGCIPPLQEALFDEGGVLRFLGSSLQTLGEASSPLSTLIAAASLVPPARKERSSEDETRAESVHADEQQDDEQEEEEKEEYGDGDTDDNIHESPIMSDPQSGPLSTPRRRRGRQSLQHFAESVRDGTASAIKSTIPRARPDTLRLLAWFVTSRLIVSPAIVTAIIAVLDNAGVLAGVPPMAKLVVLINACLPGAQMVVVLLKSEEELADSAQAVASVYLPSYLISCVTIAGWSSFGLWLVSE